MKIELLTTMVRRWSYIVSGSFFAALLSALVFSIIVKLIFKITDDQSVTLIIVPISVVIFLYVFKKLWSESLDYFK